MSEVIKVSGSMGVPHDGIKRGDRVRLLVDGHIASYTESDTAHKGTERSFTIRSEAGLLLEGPDSQQFDDAIAEVRAAAGEEDPRQGKLEDGEPGGDGVPLGNDE